MGIRENAIETMEDVGLAAAAAVNEAVFEVFDTPNPCSWTRAMAIEEMDDVDPAAAAVDESVREVFDTPILCSSTWAIAMAIGMTQDDVDRAGTDAAPAVDAVLVEVSYNIQTLGRSTAPCPKPKRRRQHGPSAPPSTRCGTYRYRHHHHHHLCRHLQRAGSPAASRSRDIATCH